MLLPPRRQGSYSELSLETLLQLYILGAVASQLIANQPQPDTAQYAKYTTLQQTHSHRTPTS